MANEEEAILSILGHKNKIPHYYGDGIRSMFITAAVIAAVSMPLWGNLLPISTQAGIAVILILVFLAGATNPRSTTLMLFNVLVSGAGVFLLEAAAIAYFHTESLMLFLLREVAAILLLFAFYSSIRSARNMMMGKVGQTPRYGEFEKKR